MSFLQLFIFWSNCLNIYENYIYITFNWFLSSIRTEAKTFWFVLLLLFGNLISIKQKQIYWQTLYALRILLLLLQTLTKEYLKWKIVDFMAVYNVKQVI